MTQEIKLGQKVKDTITGFEGIALGRTEWLYGCVRVTVQPQQLFEGKTIEPEVFDEPQLVVVEEPKPELKESKPRKYGPRQDHIALKRR